MSELQTSWSDNAVSVTVYYRKEELEDIKEWMKENYAKKLKSVSFLLRTEHNFVQAPYEPITEEQYTERMAKLSPMEMTSIGSVFEELECEGGACPVR